MTFRAIMDDVFSVGVIDWDRAVFDELIPTPEGTTYNAYIVKGTEKVALIDTVDPDKEEEFLTNLIKLGIGSIDYIVINHAEQDHSGSLPLILQLFPMAKVLATPKAKELLVHLLHVPEVSITTVEDGEAISLGGKTLEFLHTPWVHWPDTMLTYLREEGVLFSCDLFGSHYATNHLYCSEIDEILPAAKRYYAEIMMPFRNSISTYLERLEPLKIDYIAPSHGPIYDVPSLILDAYREWTSDDVSNEVVIPYISMHGSTRKMVEYFVNELTDRGINARPFNLSNADTGRLAMALVDAATVVIATPTVLFGPHPKIVYIAYLTNLLKPKTRVVSVIGSYGWGGKTVNMIKEALHNLHTEFLDPVYIKGMASAEDMKDLERLADEILKKHEEYNIV
jgi:flavorubredoxin